MASRDVGVVVGRNDERQLGTAVEGGPESLHGVLVERSCRLVEEEQLRVADERAGQGELLDHPGRAAVDALGGDFGQLELLDERIHCRRGPSAAGMTNAGEEEEIRVAGETLVERSLLAEGRTEQAARLDRAGFVTTDEHPSARRLERAGHTPEERRLP